MQSQGSLKAEEGGVDRVRAVRRQDGSRSGRAAVLGWKAEGALSPGMPAASREEKGEDTGSLPEPSGRDSAPPAPQFSPVRPNLNFWPPEL